jgi:hypothetical protein
MKIFKRSCSVNQKRYKLQNNKKNESNFIPYLYVYMSWLLMKNVVEIKRKKSLILFD